MQTSRIATIVAAGILAPAAFLAAPAAAAERVPAAPAAEQQSAVGRTVINVGSTGFTVKPGQAVDIDVTVDNSATDTNYGQISLGPEVYFDGRPGPEWNDVKMSVWNEEKQAWASTWWDPSNKVEAPLPVLDKRSTARFKLRFAFAPGVQPGNGAIFFRGLAMTMERNVNTDQATWPAPVSLPFTVLPADR